MMKSNTIEDEINKTKKTIEELEKNLEEIKKYYMLLVNLNNYKPSYL